MKRIDAGNAIFSSDEFQKDKYKFYLITQNLQSESVLLYSDEESYVICRGAAGLPTWIWTKDGFDAAKVTDVAQAMEFYLTGGPKDRFTAKKELYDLLAATGYDKLNPGDYFEMGALLCRQTKKPRECDGKISEPTRDDAEILAQFWFDDNREINVGEPIDMEQARRDVRKMLDTGKFYVWKNGCGKIVCMSNYSEADGQAKLSHVYTPADERRKGYAANLIFQMTNLLLERGLTPLLYTDYNYPPSNKAYKNAGYEEMGILINFSCSKARGASKK